MSSVNIWKDSDNSLNDSQKAGLDSKFGVN